MKTNFNYFDYIQKHFEDGEDSMRFYAPHSNHDLLDEQNLELHSFWKESKKFYLSVKKSQLFYDDFNPRSNRIKQFNNFKLPFTTSAFIFNEPLAIKWIDKERIEDIPSNLMGLIIKEVTPTGTDFVKAIGYKLDIYKAYLLFDETVIAKSESSGYAVISNQYILFGYSPDGSFAHGPSVLHLNHYPCREKNYCMISDMGVLKDWVDQSTVSKQGIVICQEIANRDSLIETILQLVDKIHESEIEIIERKKPHKTIPASANLPIKPDFKTKGNLPKPNYIQYLDGKSKRYRKGEVDIGMGTEHRYRYDVRRHPRIVNGRLIWVGEHTRGKGTYIPKVYSNRKTWFINYFWQQAEKLTKYKIAEILFIKLIYFLKRIKEV